MRIDVLGPLRVAGPDGPLAIPGARARAALSWLIANANNSVSMESLARAVWTQPPPDAAKALRMLIRSIAIVLPPGMLRIERTARLLIDDTAVDAVRFERLLCAARSQLRASAPDQAGAAVDEALQLWRGRPYSDLSHTGVATTDIDRLCALRIDALEVQQEAALSRPVDFITVAQLRYLAQLHTHRRAFRLQLARALYLSGRQVDALATLRLASAELGDNEQTRQLTTAILRRDPALGGAGG